MNLPEGPKVTSVLSVPLTDERELQNKVCQAFENSIAPEGIVTRVQEASGSKLKNSLVRSDPFPREDCGKKCPLKSETTSCNDRCYQSHCNYLISCKLCDEAIVTGNGGDDQGGEDEGNSALEYVRHLYVGESCRGCFTRFQQHAEKYSRQENFMWYHLQDVHGKTDASEDASQYFSMRRAAVDRDPLRRVVREAVKMRRVQDRETDTGFSYEEGGIAKRVKVKTILMNSKDEFHLPKLVTVDLSQQ